MKRVAFAGLVVVAAAISTAGAQQSPKEPQTEQRPPKGMCRIWLKDVPAAQQPAPTDCAAAVKNCPPNGRVIFGDTDDSTSKKPKPIPIPALTGTKSSPVKPPMVSTRK